MGYIYRLVNPAGKVYVGQTKNFEVRMRAYKKLRCKGQPKIYASLLEYGYDRHTVEVIEICENKEMYRRERYWVDLFNSFENGLNACLPENADWFPITRNKGVSNNIPKLPESWFTITEGKELFYDFLSICMNIQCIKLKTFLCHSRKDKEVDLGDLKIKLQESYVKYMVEYSKGTKIELSVPSIRFTKDNLQSFLTSWSNSANLLFQSFGQSIPQLTLVKIQ